MSRLTRWRTMIPVLALCLTLAGMAPAEDKKVDLKIGNPAPVFDSKDDQGNDWKSSDHVGKSVLVIYFYPADFTGGCTKQACGFRDDSKALTDKGVEVIGISSDSVKTHELFKKAHQLKFTLLADEDGELAKKFGVTVNPGREFKVKDGDGNDLLVKHKVLSSRWTFVIGKDGKIAYKDTKVNAAEDSKKILKVVEQLDK
jgi:peroxiredoxin Q/BCP